MSNIAEVLVAQQKRTKLQLLKDDLLISAGLLNDEQRVKGRTVDGAPTVNCKQDFIPPSNPSLRSPLEQRILRHFHRLHPTAAYSATTRARGPPPRWHRPLPWAIAPSSQAHRGLCSLRSRTQDGESHLPKPPTNAVSPARERQGEQRAPEQEPKQQPSQQQWHQQPTAQLELQPLQLPRQEKLQPLHALQQLEQHKPCVVYQECMCSPTLTKPRIWYPFGNLLEPFRADDKVAVTGDISASAALVAASPVLSTAAATGRSGGETTLCQILKQCPLSSSSRHPHETGDVARYCEGLTISPTVALAVPSSGVALGSSPQRAGNTPEARGDSATADDAKSSTVNATVSWEGEEFASRLDTDLQPSTPACLDLVIQARSSAAHNSTAAVSAAAAAAGTGPAEDVTTSSSSFKPQLTSSPASLVRGTEHSVVVNPVQNGWQLPHCVVDMLAPNTLYRQSGYVLIGNAIYLAYVAFSMGTGLRRMMHRATVMKGWKQIQTYWRVGQQCTPRLFNLSPVPLEVQEEDRLQTSMELTRAMEGAVQADLQLQQLLQQRPLLRQLLRQMPIQQHLQRELRCTGTGECNLPNVKASLSILRPSLPEADEEWKRLVEIVDVEAERAFDGKLLSLLDNMDSQNPFERVLTAAVVGLMLLIASPELDGDRRTGPDAEPRLFECAALGFVHMEASDRMMIQAQPKYAHWHWAITPMQMYHIIHFDTFVISRPEELLGQGGWTNSLAASGSASSSTDCVLRPPFQRFDPLYWSHLVGLLVDHVGDRLLCQLACSLFMRSWMQSSDVTKDMNRLRAVLLDSARRRQLKLQQQPSQMQTKLQHQSQQQEQRHQLQPHHHQLQHQSQHPSLQGAWSYLHSAKSQREVFPHGRNSKQTLPASSQQQDRTSAGEDPRWKLGLLSRAKPHEEPPPTSPQSDQPPERLQVQFEPIADSSEQPCNPGAHQRMQVEQHIGAEVQHRAELCASPRDVLPYQRPNSLGASLHDSYRILPQLSMSRSNDEEAACGPNGTATFPDVPLEGNPGAGPPVPPDIATLSAEQRPGLKVPTRGRGHCISYMLVESQSQPLSLPPSLPSQEPLLPSKLPARPQQQPKLRASALSQLHLHWHLQPGTEPRPALQRQSEVGEPSHLVSHLISCSKALTQLPPQLSEPACKRSLHDNQLRPQPQSQPQPEAAIQMLVQAGGNNHLILGAMPLNLTSDLKLEVSSELPYPDAAMRSPVSPGSQPNSQQQQRQQERPKLLTEELEQPQPSAVLDIVPSAQAQSAEKAPQNESFARLIFSGIMRRVPFPLDFAPGKENQRAIMSVLRLAAQHGLLDLQHPPDATTRTLKVLRELAACDLLPTRGSKWSALLQWGRTAAPVNIDFSGFHSLRPLPYSQVQGLLRGFLNDTLRECRWGELAEELRPGLLHAHASSWGRLLQAPASTWKQQRTSAWRLLSMLGGGSGDSVDALKVGALQQAVIGGGSTASDVVTGDGPSLMPAAHRHKLASLALWGLVAVREVADIPLEYLTLTACLAAGKLHRELVQKCRAEFEQADGAAGDLFRYLAFVPPLLYLPRDDAWVRAVFPAGPVPLPSDLPLHHPSRQRRMVEELEYSVRLHFVELEFTGLMAEHVLPPCLALADLPQPGVLVAMLLELWEDNDSAEPHLKDDGDDGDEDDGDEDE